MDMTSGGWSCVCKVYSPAAPAQASCFQLPQAQQNVAIEIASLGITCYNQLTSSRFCNACLLEAARVCEYFSIMFACSTLLW
jgi:hypothetical protein